MSILFRLLPPSIATSRLYLRRGSSTSFARWSISDLVSNQTTYNITARRACVFHSPIRPIPPESLVYSFEYITLDPQIDLKGIREDLSQMASIGYLQTVSTASGQTRVVTDIVVVAYNLGKRLNTERCLALTESIQQLKSCDRDGHGRLGGRFSQISVAHEIKSWGGAIRGTLDRDRA